MKRLKRCLSMLLVCSMVIIMLPSTALAADDETAATSGTCGENLTWELSDDGTLTISGEGEMDDYDLDASIRRPSPWYMSSEIVNVVIGEGVTSIGSFAFYGCSNLASITIPDSVTLIGQYAFFSCSSLTSITIPDGVTSIGYYTFRLCSSLTSITIPDGITYIGNEAFSDCSSLASITVPNGVTYIGSGAFSGCSSLTSITIPDSVTYLGSAFSGCTSLIDITLPDSVTSIGRRAFSGCSSLTSITIPSGVTSIEGWTFEGCSSLTSVTILGKITNIRLYTFSECSNLISITIPGSVTNIESNAFNGCSNLTDVYYGGSEEDWDSIPIYSGNSVLTKATIHYNSTGSGSITIDSGLSGKAGEEINIGAEMISSDGFVPDSSNVTWSLKSVSEEVSDEDFSVTWGETSILTVAEGDYILSCPVTVDREGIYEVTLTANGLSGSALLTVSSGFGLSVDGALSKGNAVLISPGTLDEGDPSEITWMSSDPSIITVSEKAALQLVELKKAGSVTITATAPDGSQSSLTIEVEPELVAVGTMKNSVEDGDTVKSEVTLLRAELEPGEADLAYLEKIISQVEVELSDSGDGVAQIVEPAYYEISEDGLTAEIKTDLQIIQDQEDTLTFQSTSAGNQEKTVDVDVVKTSEAIDVELDYSAYPGGSDDTARYQVAAKVTNNSAVTEWAGLRILLSEGDNASIVASYGAAEQGAETLAAGETLTFTWVIDIDQSAYPDGGNHDVVITAGFGALLISNRMLSIAVEATNGQSNELDLSDVWSFHNISEDVLYTYTDENGNKVEVREPHPITANDKNALFVDLSASGKAIAEEWLSEGVDGHCFGMSLTTILSKMNIFDITNYSSATCLQDASLTDRIWSLLCYYQFLQSHPAFVSDAQTFREKNMAGQLADIVEKVGAVQHDGSPILLGFGCTGWANHAVVAYAIESGLWTYDGTTYDSRILVYDSNHPSGNEDSYLYFNEGTGEWIIPAYRTYKNEDGVILPCMVSTNSNAYFTRACNSLDILNANNLEASLYNYIAELRIQNETAITLKNSSSQYTIMGKSGSVTGDTDLMTYYDEDAISDESNISMLHVVLPDENDAYTVSTLSGEAEELDFHISDEDLFLSVEAAAATGAAFSLDRTLALHGNTGGYELKIADDTAPEGEFNTYTFSGANAGNLSIASAEEGILVTGNDLTNVSVSGTDDESTSELTFSSDEGGVLVENEEDILVVYEDSNHDGIYETVIAIGEPAGDDADDGGSHSGSGGSSSGSSDTTDSDDTDDDS